MPNSPFPMPKILEGEAALDYNRQILETIRLTSEIEPIGPDLEIIGTLVALQYDSQAKTGAVAPTKISIPVSSTGFPEAGTLIADAEGGHRLNLEIESAYLRVAQKIIADFTQLDENSLSDRAEERTALAGLDNRETLPWRPTTSIRDNIMSRIAAETEIHVRANRPQKQGPGFKNLLNQIRNWSQLPPTPPSPGRLLSTRQENHMLIPEDSLKGYKFIPIPKGTPDFSGSIILEFDIGTGVDKPRRLVTIYPDESRPDKNRRIPPETGKVSPKTAEKRQKLAENYASIKNLDTGWRKPDQMRELLTAIDFASHPEQNHALLKVLTDLTTDDHGPIDTLLMLSKKDIQSKPDFHISVQRSLAEIAAAVKALPPDYSTLVQAMIQDSLPPLKD